jgi:triphosphatase
MRKTDKKSVIVSKKLSVAAKAERVEIPKKASVGEAADIVFAACLRHWTLNEAAVAGAPDPDGVHELRVASRRMRAALSAFHQIISASRFSWLKREINWFTGSLGMARDWDVFLAELLLPVEAARPGDAGLAKLRASAIAARKEGYAAAQQAIRSQRYSTLFERMRQFLSPGSWRLDSNEARECFDDSAVKLASRSLTKRRKAVLTHGHDFKRLLPPARHQLRIALKKLRYTVEFFSSLYSGKREEFYFHSLTHLQDSLGKMNDIVVAEHLLKHLSANNNDDRLLIASGMVTGWHMHGAISWEDQAEETWADFCRCHKFW